MRSPAHARGAPAVVRRARPINTGSACPPGGDREWGLRPHARTTCRATTWVFRQAHLTGWMQGGGGACGRRPHSRSPRGLHAERVLMPQLHRALRWSTARWAGERRRRRRPTATAARVTMADSERPQRAVNGCSNSRPKAVGPAASNSSWGGSGARRGCRSGREGFTAGGGAGCRHRPTRTAQCRAPHQVRRAPSARRWGRRAARRRSCSWRWRPARRSTPPSRQTAAPGPPSRAGTWRD